MNRPPHTAVRVGAVEAGGTKFVCGVSDADGKLLAQERFATQGPATTLATMSHFFRAHGAHTGALNAIGVACFGPLHLDKSRPSFGSIGRTPKPGWSGVDIVGHLRAEFSLPVGFDTDVNAAALAEYRWGAGRSVSTLVYLTVGTGIGGGVLINGAPLHGLMHPEIGHMYPRRHERDGGFLGVCPFHGDCFEGLAAGPAILARSGAQLDALPPDHLQWEIEADYLGQLCAQLVLALSPNRIIVGGGVAHNGLFPAVRIRMQHWLKGYVERAEILDGAQQLIVPPTLGAQAGVLGAVVLALTALGESQI